MRALRVKLIAGRVALTASALLLLGAAPDDLPHWTPGQDIVDYLDKQPDQNMFVAALKASGLRARLRGPGRFTVLAANNAAFAGLPKGMMETLLTPSYRSQLQQIMGCHIIAHEIKFGFLTPVDPKPVMTIGGCALRFSRKDGDLLVADENGIVAKLLRYDVFEANGQVEVIESVLTPRVSTIVKHRADAAPKTH